jgi:hypothetical protein
MPVDCNAAAYFDLTTRSATNNIGAATCTMWVYPASSGSHVYLDFSRGTSTSSRFEFLFNGTNWQIGGRALDADGFSTHGGAAYSNYATNWHFATARIDFSNATGYLDVFSVKNGHVSSSGAMASMTAGNTSATDSQGATVGAQPGGGNVPDAIIDDVCFYTRLLSTAELENMYYTKKNPSLNSLVHRWRLKEKHPGSAAATLVDEGTIGTATTITGTLNYAEGVLP